MEARSQMRPVDGSRVERGARPTHEVKRVLAVACPPSRNRRPREAYHADNVAQGDELDEAQTRAFGVG